MVNATKMDESLCSAGSCEAFFPFFEGSKTRGSGKEEKLGG
jgi:hypothetical protein